MMKFPRLIFVLCFATVISFSFGARPASPATPRPLDIESIKLASAGIVPAKYPEADVALVDDLEYIRYEADGTSEDWDDMAYKILTERGKAFFTNLADSYNAAYSLIGFSHITIIKPDGTLRKLPVEELTTEMIDPSSMGQKIYDPNDKIIKVNLKDIEIGDVIYFCQYKKNFKPRYPNSYSNIFGFEQPRHYLGHYAIIIDGPESLPLKRIALRDCPEGKIKQTKETANGRNTYTFDVSDVAPMLTEPRMPKPYTVSMRVLVSTIDSWNDVSKWYWNLCEPHFKATPAMKEKVQELLDGQKTEMDKIRAIFKFVAQEVRYMGITEETVAPGYEPHDIAKTFEKKHGVCRDKAALLVGMLRLAGFDAYPVLIHSGDKKDAEVANPFFNHAITAVKNTQTGDYMLMDATADVTKDLLPSYLSDMSYVVANPDGEDIRTTPVQPASENMLFVNTDAELKNDGALSARSVLSFGGINDFAYRDAFLTAEKSHRQVMEGLLMNRFPNVTVTEFVLEPADLRNIDVPLKITVSYEVPDLAVSNQSVAVLSLPLLYKSFGVIHSCLHGTELQKRKYPYKTDIACGVAETLTLRFDKSVEKPLAMPAVTPLSLPELTWSEAAEFKDGVLNAKVNYCLNAIRFSPEQYLALKDFLKKQEDELKKKYVFKLNDSIADEKNVTCKAEMLDSDLQIIVESNTAWKSVLKNKIRILTHDGKNELSQMVFNYNPAMEECKLDFARVTNTVTENGKSVEKVQEISPSEINIMDEDWVASAPRYPAGKQLVVSFPAVEVGSVIEYQVTRTVKDTPFFFLNSMFRFLIISCKRKKITISAPQSLNMVTSLYQNGYFADEEAAHQINVQETIVNEDGRTIVTWTSSEQPAVPAETQLPPLRTFAPYAVSSAGNWDSYLEELNRAFLKHSVAGSEVKNLVDSLKELKRGVEQLEKINEFFDRFVFYAGPSYVDLPRNCLSDAEVTLKDGYGCNADIAIAEYTVLKELGYSPEFILVGNQMDPAIAKMDYSYPMPSAFPHVILRVVYEGKTYWLACQDQYSNLQTCVFENAQAVSLETRRFFELTVPDNFKNKLRDEWKVVIQDDGSADITYESTVYGSRYASTRKSFMERTPEYHKRALQEYLDGISERAVATSELVETYDSYPGRISFRCYVPNYAVIDGDWMYFTSIADFLAKRLRLEKERTQSLKLNGRPFDRSVKVTITLPPHFEAVMMPQATTWSLADGKGRYALTVTQQSAQTIVLTYAVNMKCAIVPAPEVAKIRKAMSELHHQRNRTFLLKKTKK